MKKLLFVCFILSLLFSPKLKAQQLINASDLAKVYKNAEVLVVDVRKAKDYATLHITKSVNLDHKSFYQDGAISGLLKDASALYAMLGSHGLTPDKTIILYDAKSGKYSSRVFWILDYLGYSNIKILDGQLEAWKANRGAVTSAPTKGKKGTVSLSPDASKGVNMAYVKSGLNDPTKVLVDARPAVQFSGAEGTYDPKGHIPGSINLHFEDIIKGGKFLSKDKTIEVLTAHGITADKEVIIYCNTGIFAAVVYVAAKYVAGYTNVKVYDGGIAEWVSIKDNPIKTN
ncbi:MAG: sulfurtransferase [Bacteroidetes bacterium]|jgi:thiosulfate/3-mercaptopyruvate sulfurtransferase|nr:sulfurtransferase [Bacteroidota bacterium]MBT5529600.1 sulfurtransferase [Cytophagia bacterium]MBT3423306.1 sulfurtransferase [Bacteroidota bacterium]MBT3802159.1 sulfurtransferase [Bacteroidota bacterium]MBT3935411.1 sulfurtransferase [Bacteroidota bacterium]